MNSGPLCVEIVKDNGKWWCIETAITWTTTHGPYRWKWQAWFMKKVIV